jgi:hypothetical protein
MKKVWASVGTLLCACLVLLAWNYLSAHRPAATRLAQDPRNAKVTIWSYHRYGVLPGTLVLDLREFADDAAMLDVMRTVLQSAVAHKERSFDKVVLSYRGTEKFQLEGAFFQTLGKEYESQNPVYTLRTFPEHVFHLDGKQAYGSWTGGMLGVLSKQMEDLSQFGKDWYLDDAIRDRVKR